MDADKQQMIEAAIDSGDWGGVGDIITRNELVEYIIQQTYIKKVIPCPICDKNIKPYKVTFTHRSASYFLSDLLLTMLKDSMSVC